MHRLLKRQLLKYKDDYDGLLKAISESYDNYDEDKSLLERSLDLSSQELVRANIELREEKMSLKESEEKYRAVVEQSLDGIFIYRGENFLFVNKSFCTLTGYKKADVLKMKVWELAHPDDRQKLKDIMLKRNRGDEAPTYYEIKALTKTGEIKFAKVKTTKIEINNQICYLVIFIDYTDQIKQENEKIGMQKKIIQADKLASIGMLAAGIAHEINNPLLIAKGFAELIRESKENNSLTTEDLDIILKKQENALDRIANIVNGLRIFARADIDAVDNINCHKAITDTIGLIEFIYKKDNINIEFILSATKFTIVGNIGKFLQVIMNLFTNARDAILDKNGMDKVIRIITKNDKDNIVIEFSDTGTGISKDKIDKIFDPFFTTKKPGKGTGLGLSIIHSIVQELSGSIQIDSVEGIGTTFIITIPCVHKLSVKDTDVLYSPIIKLSGRVIIIDDEPDIRYLLKSQLESFGLLVDVAEDGVTALNKIKKSQYDLVITDLKMPEMSGIELIKEIQKMDVNSKIVVITGGIISDYSPEERKFIDDEVLACITKPFNKKDLYEKLKNL